MINKVLFVDDDPDILRGYKRSLRKYITIDTALGGNEGLEAIKTKGPYSVIISDLRMPGMDGIQFLSKVCEKTPNTVRMILSGDADLTAATHAVNEGKIFQFMLKPCSLDNMKKAIKAGLEQYRLIVAEKELIEKTLKGSIKILTDVLALVNPMAFGKSARVKGYVNKIVKTLKLPNSWQYEIAAMLSQIGCVTLPLETVEKAFKGQLEDQDEMEMFNNHCQTGRDLVSNIPRFEEISKIIHYQNLRYDGKGANGDALKEDKLPMGSRILKAAIDFDMLVSNNCTTKDAIMQLDKREGWYDPNILKALKQSYATEDDEVKYAPKELFVEDLETKMILNQDIFNANGALLISKGNEITTPIQKVLENINRFNKMDVKVKVLVPIE